MRVLLKQYGHNLEQKFGVINTRTVDLTENELYAEMVAAERRFHPSSWNWISIACAPDDLPELQRIGRSLHGNAGVNNLIVTIRLPFDYEQLGVSHELQTA